MKTSEKVMGLSLRDGESVKTVDVGDKNKWQSATHCSLSREVAPEGDKVW